MTQKASTLSPTDLYAHEEHLVAILKTKYWQKTKDQVQF
jgi:hypothetical protein